MAIQKNIVSVCCGCNIIMIISKFTAPNYQDKFVYKWLEFVDVFPKYCLSKYFYCKSSPMYILATKGQCDDYVPTYQVPAFKLSI